MNYGSLKRYDRRFETDYGRLNRGLGKIKKAFLGVYASKMPFFRLIYGLGVAYDASVIIFDHKSYQNTLACASIRSMFSVLS